MIIDIEIPFSDLLLGSEETELVSVYVNNHHGVPHRLGFTLGNEFNDPVKGT